MNGMYEKEYNYDGTRVTIVSPIANLTDEERGEWILREQEAGNPVIKEIERVINEWYGRR
jgi:3'-phosphoadenosine 5'-phosphosulfate sulfotransferase (PAPS reductase)/FAD synthetase